MKVSTNTWFDDGYICLECGSCKYWADRRGNRPCRVCGAQMYSIVVKVTQVEKDAQCWYKPSTWGITVKRRHVEPDLDRMMDAGGDLAEYAKKRQEAGDA